MMEKVLKVLEGALQKLIGVNDGVGTQDNLQMRFEQAPQVTCIACRAHVYFLRSTAKNGEPRFVGTGRYAVRNDLVCPACGKYLCAFEDGKPKIKTDRGWM